MKWVKGKRERENSKRRRGEKKIKKMCSEERILRGREKEIEKKKENDI